MVKQKIAVLLSAATKKGQTASFQVQTATLTLCPSGSAGILAAIASDPSRILAEAIFLRWDAERSDEEEIEEERAYASETIEDLDMQFGRLKPDIPQFLARYFAAHPESFPR
jgi:hypothetical protein